MLLQFLQRQAPYRSRNADCPDRLAGEVADRQSDAAHLGIELAVVIGDAGAAHPVELAAQRLDVGYRPRRERLELGAGEEPLALRIPERGEDDLAKRGAMGGTYNSDAVGELECASAAGAGDDDHGITHAHAEMARLAGLARQVLEDRGGEAHHLDIVESTGGEREQGPADAVALVLQLAHVAEPDHGSHQMEGGAAVQADVLRKLGEAQPVAVARDGLEDGEGAAERLHTAAARHPAGLGGSVVARGTAPGCSRLGNRLRAARRLCLRNGSDSQGYCSIATELPHHGRNIRYCEIGLRIAADRLTSRHGRVHLDQKSRVERRAVS